MNRRRVIPVLLLASACRGTDPSISTALEVSPPSVTFSALGATQRFVATVLDQNGRPMGGSAVQWAMLDSTVASVDSTGVATARRVGTTALQASVSLSGTTLSATAPITVAQVPRRLVKESGDGLTDTVTSTLPSPVLVQVEDSLAHPVPGVAVSFLVTQGGGKVSVAADTSDAGGLAAVSWTLGSSPGVNILEASVTGTGVSGNPATFLATAVAAGSVPSVVAFTGNGQTGLGGFGVNVPPAVLVRAPGGAPIAGVSVAFAVTGGAGSVGGATTITDANGIATVGSWTLAAGPNTVQATVVGAGPIIGNPVSFTATGVQRQYHIDVRLLTSMTPSQQAAFVNAANRWETLIYGDVPNVPVSIAANRCSSGTPALNETVDDIIIFARIDSIDGPGGILGQAGPCLVRSGSRFPLLGVMEFDVADADTLEAEGQLDLVIEHEMGHVLGYGTIWNSAVLVGAGGSDPHFVGPQALGVFDRIGGASYAGAKVPVENCCGASTRDSHWRETVLLSELMTGFLNAGANPLSVLTTASMGDLGYVVNYAGSDPYVLSAAPPARSTGGSVRRLGDDILRLPLIEIDPSGRIIRVHLPS